MPTTPYCEDCGAPPAGCTCDWDDEQDDPFEPCHECHMDPDQCACGMFEFAFPLLCEDSNESPWPAEVAEISVRLREEASEMIACGPADDPFAVLLDEAHRTIDQLMAQKAVLLERIAELEADGPPCRDCGQPAGRMCASCLA